MRFPSHDSRSCLCFSWCHLVDILYSEECAEDVRARMCAIQEAEIDQLRDLTSLLDTELHFVEQYLEVLRETKAGWIDE